MDEETIKNLEILERLGYFYEKNSKRFWDSNNELYFNFALEHCNDIVRIINAIVNHEKELWESRNKPIETESAKQVERVCNT